MKQLLLASLLALAITGCGKRETDQVLQFYNWSEYMPQEVLDRFEEETGIQVIYTTYDSNEALYARLKLLDDSSQYDLAVPSTYYVSKMGREGLLAPIDHGKLHGLDRLDPQLRGQAFDPGNTFSIPYLWGTTGIGVNSAAVDPATVTGWADLWRPEFRGRVMLTNDPREVFHVGLRVLGHSANTRDRGEIEAAYHKLVELMPSVRTFNSDAPRMPYLEGETDIGMIWNGEAVTGREDLPALTYVYPAEGAAIWMDSFVIPRNARNPEAAHRFIDFVLRPEIAARISAAIGYATPNLEARKLLDPEVAGNRTIYPQPEDLRNAEFQEDVGDQALLIYQEYWEKLKAGH
ncbi:MAG: extracellular solute-binding protein [Pseudomonadota bacterium]